MTDNNLEALRTAAKAVIDQCEDVDQLLEAMKIMRGNGEPAVQLNLQNKDEFKKLRLEDFFKDMKCTRAN